MENFQILKRKIVKKQGNLIKLGMVIQMKNISWKNGGKTILKNINWEVNTVDHWAIIGLNGSGKTSLLNMLNGYIWPSGGEVNVLGMNFGNYDIRDVRRNIGWASSSLQEKFYKTETALEIVLSGSYATIGLYVKPEKKDIERATDLLKQFKCDQVSKQEYWTLSQGEKQKVLITRALINSPKLLILDEPCAGLDLFAREQLLTLIGNMCSKKTSPTVLYVSHRIEEILPVFTHTLLLRNGKIHSQGKTHDVLTRKNLSSFYRAPVYLRWYNKRPRLKILS